MMKKLNKKNKNQKFLPPHFLRKNRRGDDQTTSTIVGIAILVISFIIIVGAYVILNAKQTTDQEICHNAVLTRAAGVLPKETIPLNCPTNYICLSKDGTCEVMTNPQVVKVNTADDVYNALANKMVDCWSMFGAGKANYIGDKFNKDLYCSICSQIAFDNSADNLFAINPSPIARANLGIPETYSNSLINKENFYDYLSKNNVSGTDTPYLDYFLGLQNSKSISDVLRTNDANYGYIDLKKQYLLVMGEYSRVGTFQDILSGIAKGAELFVVLPIPLVGGPAAVSIFLSTLPGTKNFKGSLVGTIITGESGQDYLTPTLIEANSEDYNKLQCADIKTLA
jgi:hypothetical protein